jgi:acetyl-CoA synthetase/medium-chain acyl-CoA synthetase
MGNVYEEARSSFKLSLPPDANFVTHVFDKYAEDPSFQAMFWVSAENPPRVRQLSYEYFAERSHRVACALHAMGLRKGDRVLLLLPRLPEWWELTLGMLRMGVVVVPSTMLLVSKDIEYRLEASGATAFIGSVDSAKQFINVGKFPSTLKYTILVDDYYNAQPLPNLIING